MPSAPSAYALHRPSAAMPRWRDMPRIPIGDPMTATPPASAIEHSPWRSACAARCIATRDEEQAVSTVTAGPSKPKAYDTRPEATLPAVAVVTKPSSSAGMCVRDST